MLATNFISKIDSFQLSTRPPYPREHTTQKRYDVHVFGPSCGRTAKRPVRGVGFRVEVVGLHFWRSGSAEGLGSRLYSSGLWGGALRGQGFTYYWEGSTTVVYTVVWRNSVV